jgi:hypothetical protein
MSQLQAVRQLGYSEEFIRMEYYLAYCEGGFPERAISDVQVVLDEAGVPAARCDLRAPGPLAEPAQPTGSDTPCSREYWPPSSCSARCSRLRHRENRRRTRRKPPTTASSRCRY